MAVKSAVSLLGGLAAFLAALIASRAYRSLGGPWVPGWIGGITLLILVLGFGVVAVTLGAPPEIEETFFIVVGFHIGLFLNLGRQRLPGRWWQIWR
ncbi:MAG: hypothetical protein FJ033_02835 [Chloroflexi bacterium]|nr:hypothetical protein [Chloroflexota bacterium]